LRDLPKKIKPTDGGEEIKKAGYIFWIKENIKNTEKWKNISNRDYLSL
jgi:hypothetical protein